MPLTIIGSHFGETFWVICLWEWGTPVSSSKDSVIVIAQFTCHNRLLTPVPERPITTYVRPNSFLYMNNYKYVVKNTPKYKQNREILTFSVSPNCFKSIQCAVRRLLTDALRPSGGEERSFWKHKVWAFNFSLFFFFVFVASRSLLSTTVCVLLTCWARTLNRRRRGALRVWADSASGPPLSSKASLLADWQETCIYYCFKDSCYEKRAPAPPSSLHPPALPPKWSYREKFQAAALVCCTHFTQS